MVWKLLGHRPSRNEWEAANPIYSYTTYKSRFNGWVNACAQFIDYKSGGTLLKDEVEENSIEEKSEQKREKIPQSRKRHIPLGLRLEVLKKITIGVFTVAGAQQQKWALYYTLTILCLFQKAEKQY